MGLFCSLFSGSSGNSVLIKSSGTSLLIDAGLSGKRIIEALNSIGENLSGLSAILVTHEHSDHIKGAGILSRKFGIPIYANEKTWEAMDCSIGRIDSGLRRLFNTYSEFEIGDIGIRPFAIPHDAADPVGFNLYIDNKTFTSATDIGHINNDLLSYFENSDFLLLESNHDIEMLKVGSYPWHLKKRIMGELGHLCNEMAGKVIAYLAEKGTSKFLLGHLSRENNFPQLAYQTVFNALTEKGIKPGKDVFLDVALRDSVGSMLEI